MHMLVFRELDCETMSTLLNQTLVVVRMVTLTINLITDLTLYIPAAAMNFLRRPKYKSVQQSDDNVSDVSLDQPPRTSNALYLGWILACAFAFSTAFLLVQLLKIKSASQEVTLQHGSFNKGFSTEFGPAKPYIHEKQSMFWGGPRWYDNGTGYHVNNPAEPTYAGPPNEEIDAAWEDLLRGRYFTITEAEAVQTFGNPHGLYLHPDGVGYLTGLDVFHALHCVEQLRRALDRNHYFNNRTKLAYPDRGHRDHCIDHIRQQLMCHADLTPIPVIWYEGHRRSFVQSDVVHTCRDWDSVRQFVASRPA